MAGSWSWMQYMKSIRSLDARNGYPETCHGYYAPIFKGTLKGEVQIWRTPRPQPISYVPEMQGTMHGRTADNNKEMQEQHQMVSQGMRGSTQYNMEH